MSLIPAGFAYTFQDDLFIKLKGTIIELIGVSIALIDGMKGGNFIGKPMSHYMSGIMSINPKRAATALGMASLLHIVIDLPLVFLLTTNQWIFYNTFLDTFIAVPIVLGTMWYAQDKNEIKTR